MGRYEWKACNNTSNLGGIVENVVDAQRAFVSFANGGRLLMRAGQVPFDAGAESRRCASFRVQAIPIDIITIADAQFARSYEAPIKTIRCLAARHGYSYFNIGKS